MRILVVDDEEDLCEILQFNLENAGFEVDCAFSAEDALGKFSKGYDLILLDVMMGGLSGYQMANKVRNDLHSTVPIIFLTAKNTENDMLTGFSLGGDDYITKPFSVQEVIARVKAILKRVPANADNLEPDVDYRDIHISQKSKTVTVEGQPVELTKKEYLILLLLCQAPGTFYTRSQILDKVWAGEAYVLERTVDVHIARLRKKLGPSGDAIINKAGFGYAVK